MAFNLSYDPNQDPEVQEGINQAEQSALEVGEKLAQEQSELLAGKYQSAADLEAAYLELQTAFTKRNQQQQEAEGDEDKSDFSDIASLADDFRAEFEEFGQLTQETADEIGEDVAAAIEQFLSSDTAERRRGVPLTEEETAQIQGLVGGPDAYREMTEWSAENLTEAQQDAYNEVMDSGDLNAIYWAVQGLKAQYTEAVGSEGRLLRGKAPTSRGDVFRSMAELVRAQSDARYDNDPAYRQDILAKLERSGDLL